MIMMILIACQPSVPVVHNLAEFAQAVEQAQPGDEIVLANGTWEDVELRFKAQGTENQPIKLKAQTKGEVVISGQSYLQLAGEHLIVEGLVFKNGYTPTSAVIEYRASKDSLCNNCRVTACVIDNFNNPERFDSDLWVAIYGKNNRFDHNHLTGKRNRGVTLAVRLNTEASRENKNRIDHNYFGPRPILGSNGGESLRIGTSHYSLTNSQTLVEYNYFDRCNGEHEIISNKSGQNIFRHNTFFECQGTLTMRHGNETLVEKNAFLGNGKSNTGGIRIINERQTVRNNFLSGLTGYRFRGALVVMNGVPNSPLNRYFQVKESEASHNTFVNCDYIQLCAGSDAERSAVPVDTRIDSNAFIHDAADDIFTVYDDISGISFAGNVLTPNLKPIQAAGFTQAALALETHDTSIPLLPEVNGARPGVMTSFEVATANQTGVSWYPRADESPYFDTGKIIPVKPGRNTLGKALAMAEAGDILELSAGGLYAQTKIIELAVPVTIRAEAAGDRPEITFERPNLFVINNGGSLRLSGLKINGSESPDQPGNAVIRTSRYAMTHNYKLRIEACHFMDLDINHSFDVLKTFPHTFADSILLQESTFEDVTGHILPLNQERDDIGIYNAENVVIEGCTFQKIGKSVLDLYRGGSDESTFGPILKLVNSRFEQVGYAKRNKTKAAIALHGVQWARIDQNTFADTQPLKLYMAVGEPVIRITSCQFQNVAPLEIEANGQPYFTQGLTYTATP